jgi:hypothetical protein
VERAIDDQPEEMRERSRLIRVEDGNRVRPLNVGFAEPRGRYIAILDDNDVPMGNWVETFRTLDHQAPGRLLRTACVRQSVRSIVVQGQVGLRAEGSPERCYTKHFDLLQHLTINQSPPVCLAFPRGAFHDLGIRFDETMTTTEDWDYLMRVVMLLGVESSTECTGVYRWWVEGESSRSDHPQAEWDRNYQAILRKIDSSPLLLPAGSTARLRELMAGRDLPVEDLLPLRRRALIQNQLPIVAPTASAQRLAVARRLWYSLPKEVRVAATPSLRRAYRFLKERLS